MVNQQVLGGNWHELRGKLKERWGSLTDDDLRSFSGDVEQLVGRIQRKTGEARDVIEDYLNQLTDEGAGMAANVRDRIRGTAEGARDAARQGYESLRQGYAEAERVVHSRPGQSLAVAFGLGLATGLGVALLLRPRSYESKFAQGRSAAEHLGRHVRDAVWDALPESLTKRVRG
jgi:uncharacterized protein YjbJ (UPF0337 family)